VIPQKEQTGGPTAISAEIAEILLYDLFEYILHYTAFRGRHWDKATPTSMIQGTDVFAAKIKNKNAITTEDDLCIIEVREKYSDDVILTILKLWINGEPLCNIYNNISNLLLPKQDIIGLEKFCRESIAYSFSFLVGNIIDLCEQLTDVMKLQLQHLQKRLKYGLKTLTSISIYEVGLSDRIIAQQITYLIGDYNLDEEQIVDTLRNNKEKIENVLQNYPSFFSEEFQRICISYSF